MLVSTPTGQAASPPKKRGIVYAAKRLWPFIRSHRKRGIFAALLLLAATLLSLPQPLLTKFIIDDVILAQNQSMLHLVVGVLVLILVAEAGLVFLKRIHFYSFEQEVIYEIQHRLAIRVLDLPKAFFEDSNTGNLMSRLSGDVHRLRTLFSRTILDLCTGFFKFAGGIVILWFLHWQLTLISLVFLPLFYVTARVLGGKTRKNSHRVMERSADVSQHLQESISGVELIKSFAQEHRHRDKIKGSMRRAVAANLTQNALSASTQLVIGLITGLNMLVILWYGALEIMAGHLTVGGFIAFNAYLAYLYGPCRLLATMHVHLQTSLAALERVFTLYDLVPEEELDGQKPEVTHLSGAVRLDGVDFVYPNGFKALHGIDVALSPGEKVALVGPTGSGKSTLVKLILGLYRPTAGVLSFDENNAAELNVRSLRSRIGVVSQDIFLFDESILENIRYGRPEADDEAVLRAAKMASAHDFIERLPQGYLTAVGEKGVRLSLGQRQRISIARALLKDPDLLIFDEATSGLDTLTEREIKQAIHEIAEHKTVILIAHRLSTVTETDRILVLEEGRLVQVGSHLQLLEEEGLYRRMWQGQDSLKAKHQPSIHLAPALR